MHILPSTENSISICQTKQHTKCGWHVFEHVFSLFFFSFHIPQYTHARYYETLPIVPEVEAAPSLNLIRQFRQPPHQHDQWLENRIFSHSHLSPLLVLFLFLSLAASVDLSVCC